MRVKIFGNITQPAAIIVGQWDPLTTGHLNLFKQLIKYSKAKRINSTVVLIYPRPIDFVLGNKYSIYYNDINFIVDKILSLGVDAVCAIRFSKRDADSNAERFIKMLMKHIAIKEMWIGFHQSFGRWREGSLEAIKKTAKHKKIVLKLLEKTRKKNYGDLLENLKKGKQAFSKIKLPELPTWKKNKKNYIELNWKKGLYKVKLLNSIITKSTQDKICEVVAKPSHEGLVRIRWPDNKFKWMVFLRGP
jgi:FAD synthase